MWRVLVVLAVLDSSVAFADEFGGWTFSSPAGSTRAESGDHVTFTKISGKTFCQFAVFSAHAPATDDAAFEWKFVVEANFTVKAASKPVTRTTKRGVPMVVTTASVIDKASNTPFAAGLYVLTPAGAAGSVLVTATDNATMTKCPIREFLDSLSLSAVPATAPPAAPAAAPAAAPDTTDSIVGSWGTGAGNPASHYGTGSTLRRQYVFKADGTYTYFSELYNGVNEWIHVRESGKYSVAGDKLTVAPITSTISSRDWNAVKGTKKQALEKVTYRFRKHYFSGIQEWNLVLTPPKPTERDGGFVTVDGFKDSYLLSSSYQPSWKWP